jgi:transcriptional regulator with XRE-family HTH domain
MHAQRIPAAETRLTTAHACLGRAIRDLRLARSLPECTLAGATHVHPCYIHALEAGRINPPFHILLWLIHGLGVTMPELFERHQRHLEPYPGRPEQLAA